MTAFADLQRQLVQLQPVKGFAPVDILSLPDSLAAVVRKMMRHGMTLAELASELDLPLDQARQVGDLLVEKGYLTGQEQGESGEIVYKVYFARMRGQNIAVDL
jgi:hypothetical protein